MVNSIYENGSSPHLWETRNIPAEDLFYKDGQQFQIKRIVALSVLLSSEPKIVGDHTSKSVVLPVSCFRFGEADVRAYAFIRDNFHDIKCSIVSGVPVKIPLEAVYAKVDKYWIAAETEVYMVHTGMPRPSGDDWYREWKGGEIVRDGADVFRAKGVHRCYCEGIKRLDLPDELFQVYRPRMSMFTVSLATYADLGFLLQRVKDSVM